MYANCTHVWEAARFDNVAGRYFFPTSSFCSLMTFPTIPYFFASSALSQKLRRVASLISPGLIRLSGLMTR